MDETSERSGTAGETGSEAADGVHMVLWTRRPVCGPRTEVIDRLSEFKSAGDIAEFTVETWPNEVRISEHTEHARVIETYEEFTAWASEQGVSVTPPFERRTVSPLVGASHEVLTVPMMCLAVYDDGLVGVYPCADGERTWNVTDYLDAFEAVDGRPAEAESVVLPTE